MLHQAGEGDFAAAMTDALGASEYVGQQGLASASEMLRLVRLAGVDRDSLVVDVCCGPGGPARWLNQQIGCRVLGIDRSIAALRLALSPHLPVSPSLRLSVDSPWPLLAAGEATRLPITASSCDAVMMLESMVAIRDKAALLDEAATVLRPGGSFACTVELGRAEQVRTCFGATGATQVHLTEATTLRALLTRSGFRVRAWDDLTAAHAHRARRLNHVLQQRRRHLSRRWGPRAFSALLDSTSTWAELLSSGLACKAAVVAELADP